MKIKPSSIFLLFRASLILLLLASCGPAVLAVTDTPAPTATLEILATPILDTPAPACSFPCPEDSIALTAAMGTAFAATPSNTPPPWATIFPAAGDLGWGSVYGIISDGVTNLPIEGATVKCEQSSYTSHYLCNGVTTTNSDGIYSFVSVFFHDSDRITLIVEAHGYAPLHFEQAFFTRPEFHADLGLFPVTVGSPSPTPTPFAIMCTPPPCSDGILVCGALDGGCMGGCGAMCLPFTPTPP